MQVHEFGRPDGTPLVFFLGMPQTGESGVVFDELASAHGIRLICPTRPWHERTDLMPSFTACTNAAIAYLNGAGITSSVRCRPAGVHSSRGR